MEANNVNFLKMIIMKIFLIVIVTINSIVKVYSQTSEQYFNITLEDHFKYDTVSLYINNVLILNKAVLISDKSTGITGYYLIGFLEGDQIIISSNKLLENIRIPFYGDQIDCKIILNDKMFSKVFNINNGVYIGIFKHLDAINTRQSKTKYIYD